MTRVRTFGQRNRRHASRPPVKLQVCRLLNRQEGLAMKKAAELGNVQARLTRKRQRGIFHLLKNMFLWARAAFLLVGLARDE